MRRGACRLGGATSGCRRLGAGAVAAFLRPAGRLLGRRRRRRRLGGSDRHRRPRSRLAESSAAFLRVRVAFSAGRRLSTGAAATRPGTAGSPRRRFGGDSAGRPLSPAPRRSTGSAAASAGAGPPAGAGRGSAAFFLDRVAFLAAFAALDDFAAFAGLAASAACSCTSRGCRPGTAMSMPRRDGLKLTTTNGWRSPSPTTSRALRGGRLGQEAQRQVAADPVRPWRRRRGTSTTRSRPPPCEPTGWRSTKSRNGSRSLMALCLEPAGPRLAGAGAAVRGRLAPAGRGGAPSSAFGSASALAGRDGDRAAAIFGVGIGSSASALGLADTFLASPRPPAALLGLAGRATADRAAHRALGSRTPTPRWGPACRR